MKQKHKLRLGALAPCLIAALLCGMLALTAFAVNPDEVELTLTWSGVDTSQEKTVKDGDLVTDGFLSLYEDGIQVQVGGENLIPIDPSGTTTIAYSFDPAKTYTITVEEKAAAPYYKTKDIAINAGTAHTSGETIADTVEWVQWSKPIKVTLVDAAGAPIAQKDVNVSLYDIDNLIYQFYEENRKTNVGGTATFPSHSYDIADPLMTNILNDQVMVSAEYVPASGGNKTTVAKIVRLDWNPNKNKNEVSLAWPTATVSGTVYQSDGVTPVGAGTRVAAYYDLPGIGNNIIDYTRMDYSNGNNNGRLNLSFIMTPTVYYTTTDASGHYTLALPEGARTVELCAGDGQGPEPSWPGIGRWYTGEHNTGLGAANYYKAVAPHFPWISPIDPMEEGFIDFRGVYCQEVTPVMLRVTGDVTGQDLTLVKNNNGYDLNVNNITLHGASFPASMGDASLTFAAYEYVLPSQVHQNAFKDTVDSDDSRNAIQNGSIHKTGVRLVPGKYRVYLTCASSEYILNYIYTPPVEVEILASDVMTGVVNLGDLDFKPIPRPISPNGKSPAEILSHYKPIPTPYAYYYVDGRIEATPDPAYGPFAYQFTVHYCAHYTGSTPSGVMPSAQFKVELPANVTVKDPGKFSVSGTDAILSLSSLKVGEVGSATFTADITDTSGDSTFTLFGNPCYAGINKNPDGTWVTNGFLTLHRPRLTLNAPRTVNEATKFRVFGSAAGMDEDGFALYNKGTGKAIATGALKGRYYYFNAPGMAAGNYTLYTQGKRHGTDEASNDVDVEVKAGAMQVDDAYIMRAGKKTGINANFGMVYYTSFVDTDKRVPDCDIYFKLNQTTTDPVELDIGGLTYTAALDPATPGYYKVSIHNNLYASGEQAVLLKVGSTFTTQLACLMLMF